MPARPFFLQRQSRLGAIERLDLALLVDREDERLVGRIEIEADHVWTFSTKRLSFDSLKAFTKCGFSPRAFQIFCTLVQLMMPTALAILRMLQCVHAAGLSCRVF